MIPATENVTPEAKARLEILQRFTELGAHLDREVAGLRELISQGQAQSDSQAARHDYALQQAMTESTNSLAACIGQVDDKLDQALSRG